MLETLIMSTHVKTLKDMVGEAMCRCGSLGGGEFFGPKEVFVTVPYVHSIVEFECLGNMRI